MLGRTRQDLFTESNAMSDTGATTTEQLSRHVNNGSSTRLNTTQLKQLKWNPAHIVTTKDLSTHHMGNTHMKGVPRNQLTFKIARVVCYICGQSMNKGRYKAHLEETDIKKSNVFSKGHSQKLPLPFFLQILITKIFSSKNNCNPVTKLFNCPNCKKNF